MPYLKFNLLAMKYLTYQGYDNFDLTQMIDAMHGCNIRLDFPKDDQQEIQLTISGHSGIVYLESDLGGLYFAVPLGELVNGNMVGIDSDKVLLEVVNQARAYQIINRNYKFHFTTANPSLKELIDDLNAELNDYLERKER
ncbi:MAG: hypothetical protein IKO86_00690 [Prevotella sp.]|nr:hypothetical protein [Prevotella sp.]